MEALLDVLGIGKEPGELTVLNVCTRGVLVFSYCIFLVRIADKRFLSQKSAFDAVLGFIIASMMARAINGSGPLVPTLAGGLVLVLFHRGLAHLAMHWSAFGTLIKGRSEVVVKDGKLVAENLRSNSFSEADLKEDLRLNGLDSHEKVRLAHVERNGRVSVVRD